MINTLLEPVPMKIVKSARVVAALAVAAVSATTSEVEDLVESEDSEDEEDEDDDEDTEMEGLDEEVPLISSDEEAELEAQRIHFHELLSKSLLQPRSSAERGSISSNISSVEGEETKEKIKQKEERERKKRSVEQVEPKAERSQTPLDAKKQEKQSVEFKEGRERKGTKLLAQRSISENCGRIYLHAEEKRLEFHCTYCDRYYEELSVYIKHLQATHLQGNQDLTGGDGVESGTTRAATIQRKSTRIGSKQAAVVVSKELEVKQEENGGPLSACGTISARSGNKIVLACCQCERKYVNAERFHQHWKNQHELCCPTRAVTPLSNEPAVGLPVDVTATATNKEESKDTIFILTEVENSKTKSESPSSPPLQSSKQCENSEPLTQSKPKSKSTSPLPECGTKCVEDDLLLAPIVPSQTPETPPPEEEEVEKKVEQKEELQPSKVTGKEDLDLEKPKCSSRETSAEKISKPQEMKETKEKSVKGAAKRGRKRKSVARLSMPTLESKRRRTKPTAPAAPVERVRRRSAANKMYKDSYSEHEPPSSPESAHSSEMDRKDNVDIKSTAAQSAATTAAAAAAVSVEEQDVKPPSSSQSRQQPQQQQQQHQPKRQLRFPCDQCTKSFNKASRLAEHQRLHTGEKPFRCDECGKCFRIKMRLNEHQLRHRKEKAFKCELCGLAVATKQDMTQHQRHHNGDRRYQCKQCPKAFVRGSDLKIHVRVHTGEKPFICEICNKSFRANQNLIVHRKSHGGEKNYKCDFCDKRFMRNIDRKVHHRTHTGEKPYKCEICQRGYSSRVHVRAHIEREHVANSSGAAKGRRKPGPKPKVLKEELVKQKKLIQELRHQLMQHIQSDEKILIDLVDEQKAEIEEQDSNSTTTAALSPLSLRQSNRKLLNAKGGVAVGGGGGGGGVGGGMQQVSVTVSMQVENVAVDDSERLLPVEKENADTLLTSETAASIKKERKITSYFTVVGQKTEI